MLGNTVLRRGGLGKEGSGTSTGQVCEVRNLVEMGGTAGTGGTTLVTNCNEVRYTGKLRNRLKDLDCSTVIVRSLMILMNSKTIQSF